MRKGRFKEQIRTHTGEPYFWIVGSLFYIHYRFQFSVLGIEGAFYFYQYRSTIAITANPVTATTTADIATAAAL